MTRALVALLALAALLAAALWYATSSGGPERPEVDIVDARARTEEEPRTVASDLASVAAPRTQASEPVAQATERASLREATPTARDEELDRAHWVEGRVVFPPHTPLDEEVVVVATGRDFASGGHHRAKVGPDGSFRVAFSEETMLGRLELEARYLALRPARRWKRGDDGPFVLEPELGGRVVVRVLAPASAGDEVRQGTVSLYASDRVFSGQQRVKRSLADGLEVAFGALSPGDVRVAFDGKRWIGATDTVAVAPGETRTVDLELSGGVTLAGRVVDEQGVGIEKAQINANARRADGAGPERHRYLQAGADGAFELGPLAPGKIGLLVGREGYERLEVELGPFEPGEARTDLELVLPRGGTIAGSVSFPDGSPAQARIELVPKQVGFGYTPPVTGESDADGTFRISGLSEDAYTLRALTSESEIVREPGDSGGPGRKRRERTLWTAELHSVAAGAEGIAIVLSTGFEVRGRVVDDRGVPLDAFEIEAATGSGLTGFQPDLQETYTDANGAFVLAGFTAGTWRLEASARGHGKSETVQVTLPGGGPVELRVPREARVSGVVLGLDGAPFRRATVEARPQGDEFGMSERQARTDAEGAFTIRGLQPGRAFVTATGSGAAPSEPLALELEPGEEATDVVLRLRAGAVLTGEVVDRAGRGEGGVQVRVNSADMDFLPPVSTGPDGRFEVSRLAPGPYFVSATNGEGLRLSENATLADGATVHVRLAPPSAAPVRLRGRLVAAGEPLAKAFASAHGIVGGTGGRMSMTEAVHSDADGRFEIALPEPGSYRLNVNVNEPSHLMWSTQIDVPAVAEHHVDLVVPLGRVSGVVTDAAGKPLEGAPIQSHQKEGNAIRASSAFTATDAEGGYEIVLPAGEHTLVAGGNAYGMNEGPGWIAQRREGVEVREGGHATGVDFVLDVGGSLEGSVRTTGAGSLDFAQIWSESVSLTEPVGWARRDGGFRIDGLAPGTHLLRAASNGHATRDPVRATVAVGQVARVELELEPAALVRAIVRDASGKQTACALAATDSAGRAVPCRQPTGEGTCVVGPLVSGRYTLRATLDGKTAERTIDVTAGTEMPLVELAFE